MSDLERAVECARDVVRNELYGEAVVNMARALLAYADAPVVGYGLLTPEGDVVEVSIRSGNPRRALSAEQMTVVWERVGLKAIPLIARPEDTK
jgi:hypothetical protein